MKKQFVFGLIVGILVCSIVTVYASNPIFFSRDISYDNSTSGLNSTNVQNAIDELIEKVDYYKVNFELVVAYNTYLGWSGGFQYGAAGGTITIRRVNGETTVTNSGGVKHSGTSYWNGNYYISSMTSDFRIVSFTILD